MSLFWKNKKNIFQNVVCWNIYQVLTSKRWFFFSQKIWFDISCNLFHEILTPGNFLGMRKIYSQISPVLIQHAKNWESRKIEKDRFGFPPDIKRWFSIPDINCHRVQFCVCYVYMLPVRNEARGLITWYKQINQENSPIDTINGFLWYRIRSWFTTCSFYLNMWNV